MSPWWNNLFAPSCDVAITQDSITLSQAGKIVASAAISPIVGDDTLHNRILLGLRTLIHIAPTSSKRHVNIWLSPSLVPHGVVQIDARAMKAADIETTLKAYWEDTLDLPADALAVAYQIQADGQSVFTSCCESALVNALEATLRNANWGIKNLAPSITKTWNDSSKQIGKRNCCMLVVQDNTLSMGVLHNGQWAAWSNEGCENTEWPELAKRVTRFCRSTGMFDTSSLPVWVYSPHAIGTPNALGLHHWSLLHIAPTRGMRV